MHAQRGQEGGELAALVQLRDRARLAILGSRSPAVHRLPPFPPLFAPMCLAAPHYHTALLRRRTTTSTTSCTTATTFLPPDPGGHRHSLSPLTAIRSGSPTQAGEAKAKRRGVYRSLRTDGR